jgi:hypothetical protein
LILSLVDPTLQTKGKPSRTAQPPHQSDCEGTAIFPSLCSGPPCAIGPMLTQPAAGKQFGSVAKGEREWQLKEDQKGPKRRSHTPASLSFLPFHSLSLSTLPSCHTKDPSLSFPPSLCTVYMAKPMFARRLSKELKGSTLTRLHSFFILHNDRARPCPLRYVRMHALLSCFACLLETDYPDHVTYSAAPLKQKLNYFAPPPLDLAMNPPAGVDIIDANDFKV